MFNNDARESDDFKVKLSNAMQQMNELSNHLALTQRERDLVIACSEEKEKMMSELSATIDELSYNMETKKSDNHQQLKQKDLRID